MRLKRIWSLHYVFLMFTLFLLMFASFFPILWVSGLRNNGYQLVSSSGTVDYPPPPESPTHLYPFWSSDSYWHMKIKENPTLHPNSAQMIDWLINDPNGGSEGAGGNVYINWRAWTKPIWDAYEDTPTYTIYKSDKVTPRFYDVPIPEDAKPAIDGDHSFSVIDWYNRYYYDFWNFFYEDGKYWAGDGYKYDLDSDGLVPPGTGGSVGGSNTPFLALAIRDEEIEAGVIKHPIGCCMHDNKKDSYVFPPASRSDGKGTATYAIPMGARIQLDPSVDIDAYGLNPTAKIIAKALQDYGCVLKESGGGWFLYAEHDFSADWDSNMTNGILANLPNDKWRVIDYTQGATVNLELPG